MLSLTNCRTGAAVALYRFERDGWTIDDVSAEMRRQTYREGWLPGYIFGMVKRKPLQDLYEPAVALDRNRPAHAGGKEATEGRPVGLEAKGPGVYVGELQVPVGRTMRLSIRDGDGVVASADLPGPGAE